MLSREATKQLDTQVSPAFPTKPTAEVISFLSKQISTPVSMLQSRTCNKVSTKTQGLGIFWIAEHRLGGREQETTYMLGGQCTPPLQGWKFLHSGPFHTLVYVSLQNWPFVYFKRSFITNSMVLPWALGGTLAS